jgi:hypothetical protein
MENYIYLLNDCHVTLTKNIYAKRGQLNYFYYKIFIKLICFDNKGLCNGTFGIIKEIIYPEIQTKNCLPEKIIIHFPKYSGSQFFNDIGKHNWLLINPYVMYSKVAYFTRKQFSLLLAYAITTHKTQSETLEKGIVHLGKSKKHLGTTFVQFSRFKNLTDFLDEPFSYDRLTMIAKSSSLLPRIKDEERLKQLNILT